MRGSFRGGQEQQQQQQRKASSSLQVRHVAAVIVRFSLSTQAGGQRQDQDPEEETEEQ